MTSNDRCRERSELPTLRDAQIREPANLKTAERFLDVLLGCHTPWVNSLNAKEDVCMGVP